MLNKKPILIKTKLYYDQRGYFKELLLKKKIKFNSKFTACSFSKKNVIRGLHYQIKKPQEKIISVLKGKAIDVCINIDRKSKNFGKIFKFILKPGLMLYVPKNYAHGIGFHDKENILLYHLTQYRFPQYERGINPLDKNLNINWNIKKPILSERDRMHPLFKNIYEKAKT
jgi:dTDP-4-dehydrorhamnose 3,5-epimerase